MIQTQLNPANIIAEEIKAQVTQVETAIALLDGGATVPFIARYRKEATGGLSDTQLRKLTDRLYYLRELEERRAVIIDTIRKQEKLTPDLEANILAADTKNRLEDLYLPFRPKRRTKAQIAQEAGLEPLALSLWKNPTLVPETEALAFIDPVHAITDVSAALEGARHILMEKFSEEADLLNDLREYLWKNGTVRSTVVDKKQEAGSKFSDYFKYSEAIKKIPSHRALALFRGRREGFLQLALTVTDEPVYCESKLASYFNIYDQQRAADPWLLETVRLTWKTKLFTKLELELLNRLRESADEAAIKVFAQNLFDLLLASPAGAKATMGLDPGIRTGVKVAVIDNSGKLLDYATIFPFVQNEWHEAIVTLAKLAAKYEVELISIGNGTASRETERLVAELIKMYPDLKLNKMLVSEAGASVYSASELACEELPDIDVSIRGAVSIARRLQDPLAELVKIDPKAIGVGQYQHDVNQARLARSLDGVVEDCVNRVGVDLNTASPCLLTRVSGFNETLAHNVIAYRNQNGAFRSREALKAVPRMGEKTFQQCAGFLRIANGDNPLDASCVHPEAYPLVDRILVDKGIDISQALGNSQLLQDLEPQSYVSADYGLPTIKDVLAELDKPGRDPRSEFKMPKFKEGVEDISQLQIGMVLEGVVSNVTHFGAFVDIGVHQDGLVHISAMTHRFIQDPHQIVKAGDIVQVKVTEVDVERRRIGLTMKLEEKAPTDKKTRTAQREHPIDRVKHTTDVKKPAHFKKSNGQGKPAKVAQHESKANKSKPIVNTAMADALAKLKRNLNE